MNKAAFQDWFNLTIASLQGQDGFADWEEKPEVFGGDVFRHLENIGKFEEIGIEVVFIATNDPEILFACSDGVLASHNVGYGPHGETEWVPEDEFEEISSTEVDNIHLAILNLAEEVDDIRGYWA